jgi:hypothetical protein
MTSGRPSLYTLYIKVDNLKKNWRKQLLLKLRYKQRYLNLLEDYKKLLVENSELKRIKRDNR